MLRLLKRLSVRETCNLRAVLFNLLLSSQLNSLKKVQDKEAVSDILKVHKYISIVRCINNDVSRLII